MKFYNSRYTTALFSLSAAVCMVGGCVTGSKKQAAQEKFKTVWQEKGKDLLKGLNEEFPELNRCFNDQSSINQLNTSKKNIDNCIHKFIKDVQDIYIKLPGKELDRFVDELQKSENVLTTLSKKSPASVQEKTLQICQGFGNELQSEIIQLLKICEKNPGAGQLLLLFLGKNPGLLELAHINLTNVPNIQAE